MTALVWDQVGERFYQTGIDRGVLHYFDGEVERMIPWNGLISVEESPETESKSFYLDGVKYLENILPGDFLGKLKAFTYPDEFNQFNGIASPAPGIYYHDQPSKSFDLTYRTKIGNDIDGTDHGYRIHILYNIVAVPDSFGFDTLDESNVHATEFSWGLSGTPTKIHNLRPTVHISMDSTKTPPEIWKMLENILYGTDTSAPTLPTMDDIGEIYGFLGALLIVDNGDGTWQAIDESDTYISFVNGTTEFQIVGADAEYLDPVTYEISTTNYGPDGKDSEEVK